MTKEKVMRCKPGDIAWLRKCVDAPLSPNLGKYFKVLRLRDDQSWWVEVLSPGVVAHVDGVLVTVAIGTEAYCPDDCLTPLRDQPGEDETLTWAGKPIPLVAPETV